MAKLAQAATYGFLLVAAASCTNEPQIRFEPPAASLNAPLPVQEVTHTDIIVQIVPPIVDVLWTVDNSCSMEDEQTALTENFPKFIDYFIGSGLDYHVGVISTDLDDDDHAGQLQTYLPKGALVPIRFIDEDTDDPMGAFTAMAAVGTDGSGTEKGRGAVYTALGLRRNDPSNIGFYRQEASIHTILISDEDDDTQDFVITQQEFINWYKALKSGGWRRTFSSIVSPEGEGMFNGGPYLEITKAIGGIPWNINSDAWDQVLDRLGVEASGLRREFFLSQRPVPDTIEVTVTTEIDGALVTTPYAEAEFDIDGNVTGHWLYDEARNSIRFVDLIPEPLSRVEITYVLLASTVEPEE